MSLEYDIHGETESEGGGVPLSKLETEEMDIDELLSPAYASTSSSADIPAVSLANTSDTTSPSVLYEFSAPETDDDLWLPPDHLHAPPFPTGSHVQSTAHLDALLDTLPAGIETYMTPNFSDPLYAPYEIIDADYLDDHEDDIHNYSCDEFFEFWKRTYVNNMYDYPKIGDLPNSSEIVQRPDKIAFKDLECQQSDFQGIYWLRLQTTREDAREVRRMTYRNHANVMKQYGNHPNARGPVGRPAFKAKFQGERATPVPKSDGYFHFQEMNMKYKADISHFQLRHNVSASSKNAVFYNEKLEMMHEDRSKIMCINPETDSKECAMDLTHFSDRETQQLSRVSTLAAGDGVLVAGGFNGAYAIKSLSAAFDCKYTTGIISNARNSSTNHVSTFLDRQSGMPQVVFDSNDMTIRVLDCCTEIFVRHHKFEHEVNCSATSPDGRLRLLVGDNRWPAVANAETGEVIAKLPDHKDFGFACAWAPDGVTMATGHQDGLVQVWDARKLTQSIHVIPMEMGGCRAMQFSPVGAGKRVLVLSEPADFVHVVDAGNFQSRQEIEFFGEIAGISMPPDGSKLYIANWDHKYGGLMEFDRSWNNSGFGRRQGPHLEHRDVVEEDWAMMNKDARLLYNNMLDFEDHSCSSNQMDPEPNSTQLTRYKSGMRTPIDWLPDSDLDDNARVILTKAQRDRRGLGAGSLIF